MQTQATLVDPKFVEKYLVSHFCISKKFCPTKNLHIEAVIAEPAKPSQRIRHLVWDTVHGFELRSIYISGWSVVAASVVLTVAAWVAGALMGGRTADPQSMQNMRTPLARAIGLGPAKKGVGAWWAERVSAVALVPLTLWFAASIIAHSGSDYATFIVWLRTPLAASSVFLRGRLLMVSPARGDDRRCQAEIPLIVLCRFPGLNL